MDEAVDSLCRICLKNIDQTDSQFEAFGFQECSSLFREVLRLDMIQDDTFPSHICNVCHSELIVVSNFMSKCRSTNERLQECLSRNISIQEYLRIKEENECGEGNSDLYIKQEVDIEFSSRDDTGDSDSKLPLGESKNSRCTSEEKSKKIWQCDMCAVTTQSESALKTHSRVHTGEKPFKCQECDKCFKQKGTLQQHILRRHKRNIYLANKNNICDVCGKQFFNKNNLKIHMRIHTNERPYSCPYCPHRFAQIGTLAQHKRLHTGERPYKCIICEKTCKTASDRAKHMKVHSNEKNFKCEICNTAVKSINALRKHHENIHSNEKPFICDKCGISFAQKGNLKAHTNRMHSELAGTCEVCKKVFSDLSVHNRVHTGEKVYNCEICGRGFPTKRPFIVHLKKHENATKYPCTKDKCEAAFPTQGQLKIHTWKYHSSFVPHSCEVCSKGFYRLSDYSKHKRISNCMRDLHDDRGSKHDICVTLVADDIQRLH